MTRVSPIVQLQAQDFKDSGRRGSHWLKAGQEGLNIVQHEKNLRKRKRSHSSEPKNRHKSRRRSSSRQRNEADRHRSRSRQESRPHKRHSSTKATEDHSRRRWDNEGRNGVKRAKTDIEGRRSPRKKNYCPGPEQVRGAPDQRCQVKRELLDPEKLRGTERRLSC